MEISIHQLLHVDKMISGFENFILDPTQDDPDVVYMKSALTLEGLEVGTWDGSESFFGKVKEVGIKFYEYVKRFLKAIWDWFFSPSGAKQTKSVDMAVAAVESSAKQLPKIMETQGTTEEVKTEIVEKVNEVVEQAKSSTFHIANIGDKFVKNKDGVFTDIRKTAKSLGIEIPEFVEDFKAIEVFQDRVMKQLDAKRAKSGEIHGTVNSLQECVYLTQNYKALRNVYLKILAQVNPILEVSNNLAKTSQENRNQSSEHEKLFRSANKVNSFLLNMQKSFLRGVNNCSKNVQRIANAFSSIYLLVDYEASEKRFLEEVQHVPVNDEE